MVSSVLGSEAREQLYRWPLPGRSNDTESDADSRARPTSPTNIVPRHLSAHITIFVAERQNAMQTTLQDMFLEPKM
jgi:hypothetical protein